MLEEPITADSMLAQASPNQACSSVVISCLDKSDIQRSFDSAAATRLLEPAESTGCQPASQRDEVLGGFGVELLAHRRIDLLLRSQ